MRKDHGKKRGNLRIVDPTAATVEAQRQAISPVTDALIDAVLATPPERAIVPEARVAMITILRALGVSAPIDAVTALASGCGEPAVTLQVDFNLRLDADGVDRLTAIAAALAP